MSLPETATTSDAPTTFSPEEQQRVAQLRERQEAIAKETQEWEAVEQELKVRGRAVSSPPPSRPLPDLRATQEKEERREKLSELAEQEAIEEEEANKRKELQQQLRESKENLVEADRKKREAEAAAEAQRKAEEDAAEAKLKEQKQAENAVQSMGMGMDSLFVKEPRRKRVTTAMKKAVLGDKGKQKNEEVHMINSIKRRQKIKSGQVEAIRSLRFTVGTEETNAFETKNVKLAADGLAHFKRMEKGIGQHTQIVVDREDHRPGRVHH